jgi:hypothetical protein
MFATLNGKSCPVAERSSEAAAIVEIERMIDHVNSTRVDGDRWPANFYIPGTYEMCPEGIHPQELGGTCTHSTCLRPL